MSFMTSEGGGWSDKLFSYWNPVANYRERKQTRELAEAGIATSGLMDIRAKRREAAVARRLGRQRQSDLYAQTALQRRLSNAALAGRPRVGGSVLGGRGGRYA